MYICIYGNTIFVHIKSPIGCLNAQYLLIDVTWLKVISVYKRGILNVYTFCYFNCVLLKCPTDQIILNTHQVLLYRISKLNGF